MQSSEKPLYVRRAEVALQELQDAGTQAGIQKAQAAAITYAVLALVEELQKTGPKTHPFLFEQPAG